VNVHHAERLPIHRGPAAWNSILPAQPASAPLMAISTSMSRDPEVCVVLAQAIGG
jgi:hypothetical protein